MESNVYYKRGDQVLGPVSKSELDYLQSIGRVNDRTPVRLGLSGDWHPLKPSTIKHRASASATPASAMHTVSPVPKPAIEANRPVALESSKERSFAKTVEAEPLDTTESLWRQLGIAALLACLLLLLISLSWQSGGGVNGGGAEGPAQSKSGSDAGEGQPAPQERASNTGSTGRVSPQVPEAAVSDTVPVDSEPKVGATEDSSEAPPGDTSITNENEATTTKVVPGDPGSKFTISAVSDTTFFGVGGSGSRFAFVVDRSGSMAGGRIERAREELISSIKDMSAENQVMIVFFDDQAFPYSGGVVSVTVDNMVALERWINQIDVGGGTNATAGVREVFRQWQPDVIFLLTDGELSPSTPSEIQTLNIGLKTQINTIALVSNTGEAVLRKIAADNRGEYRFVP